jgi:hypothetical protein
MYLNGKFIIDDDGLHGMVERCAQRDLPAGGQTVYVTGFQAWGGVGMEIKYSGPDTGGQMVFMRLNGPPLQAAGKYYPTCDPTAKMADERQFTMCLFRSEVFLGSMPKLGEADNGRSRLYFIGRGKVPIIDMHNLEAYRSYVPATPPVNYAWAFFGRLKIATAGTYTLCISSDDG